MKKHTIIWISMAILAFAFSAIYPPATSVVAGSIQLEKSDYQGMVSSEGDMGTANWDENQNTLEVSPIKAHLDSRIVLIHENDEYEFIVNEVNNDTALAKAIASGIKLPPEFCYQVVSVSQDMSLIVIAHAESPPFPPEPPEPRCPPVCKVLVCSMVE